MILSDTQIRKRIGDKSLIITNYNDENINPCSYDLTLASGISEYTSRILDVRKDNPVYQRTITSEGIILTPGTVYLAYCNEHLTLPNDLRGTLCGKSSIGRLGLMIHLTAGFIDPGFRGSLVLELSATQPIRIYPNIPIAQIEFAEVYPDIAEGYGEKKKSKYQDQVGAQASKFYLNS